LEEDLHPSMPFPTKKFQLETPLHLAAEAALGKLIKIFLEHGGNPNSTNGREETCLHSICRHPGDSLLRLDVMNTLLQWRSSQHEDGEEPECVSINHVDIDGNAAVHYASINGLTECVERLISLGAIISIVNKAQRTCCELADAEGYHALAGALELALVFQPADISMEEFDQSESEYFVNRSRHPMLGLDCESMKHADVSLVIDEMLADFCSFSHETLNRAESLLEAYSWDIAKLKREYYKSSADVYKSAQIEPVSVTLFEPDSEPWLETAAAGGGAGVMVKTDMKSILLDGMNQSSFHLINEYPPTVPTTGASIYTGTGAGAGTGSAMIDFDSIERLDSSSHISTGIAGRLGAPLGEVPSSSKSHENLKGAGTGEETEAQNLSSHPIFKSSPCSICQEMMLHPVAATAAMHTYTSSPVPLSTLFSKRTGAVAKTEDSVEKGWRTVLSNGGAGSSMGSVGEQGQDGDGPVSAVPHLDQRALQCQSGHIFCIACWKTYASLQACTASTHCTYHQIQNITLQDRRSLLNSIVDNVILYTLIFYDVI
jgi:hypothetical protein